MKLSYITVLLITFTFGYSREYTFERITSKDGLSQNNVISIYQCSDGFMWFATYDGLNRYDGYDFKVYRTSTEDTNSISDNLISYITEDDDKNLWIGTFNNGVCRFNKETEQFTIYEIIPGLPDIISGEITHILCDSNEVWLSNIHGAYYFERYNNKITNARKISKTNDPNSLLHEMVYQVFKDSDKNIFVVTKGGVDLMRRGANGEILNNFRHVILTDKYKTIQQMDQTPEGYLMCHSLGLLLLKFNPSNPEIKELIPLEEHYCKRFTVDTKGNIWAGGDEGIFRLEHTGDKALPYKLKEHFVTGDTWDKLSHKVIRSIFTDREGMVWIGTNGGGILKCNITKAKFRHYKKTKLKGSLSANQVWNIYEDPEHNLWFSTEGGGLNLIPASSNKDYKTGFIDYRVNPVGEQNFAFQMIDFSRNGKTQYLVGTGYENKIVKLEKHLSDWKITSILPEIEWQVMALCKDEHGAAWLGTYNEGLFRLVSDDGLTYKLDHFTPDNSNNPSNIIRSIFEDTRGRLWIGTDLGLAIVPREEKNKPLPEFVVITNIPGDTTSLSHNYTVPVMETKSGEIWIGTFGGSLNKYIEGTNETNGTFIRLGIKDGLANNTIKQIVEDDIGNLWVSSNKGLSRIDTSRTKIRNFDMSDGLQDLEFTDLSGSKLSDGEIIFGGVNGFNAFYPHELYEDTTAPIIVFTDLVIKNNKVEINKPINGELILRKAINNTQNITLKHFHNNFRIHFAAIYYDVPEGNQYKYTLEGFDNQWIETTHNARFAMYTNMKHGKYTFKLLASNSQGYWAKTPKTINIIIKPPFWLTWWFISFDIILILGIIYLLFYWRTRQIRKRNLELEREVKIRTKEIQGKNAELQQRSVELNEVNVVLEERQQQIEEQAEELRAQKEELISQRDNLTEINELLKERQRKVEEQSEELTLQRDELIKANAVKDKLFTIVAHDLKNPFNTLAGFLDILILKYDKYTEQKRKIMLTHAKGSVDVIQGLLLNLLSWARSQTGAIQFKPGINNIVEILESNIKLVDGQAKEKNIEVKLSSQTSHIELIFDADLMNNIIRNLLINALKFTPSEGLITINCVDYKNRVEISVIDNGVGISEENLAKLFRQDTSITTHGTNNESGTGLGLITCKEFVEMHKGTISVKSKEGVGTTFTVVIPKLKFQEHH